MQNSEEKNADQNEKYGDPQHVDVEAMNMHDELKRVVTVGVVLVDLPAPECDSHK